MTVDQPRGPQGNLTSVLRVFIHGAVLRVTCCVASVNGRAELR